MSYWMVALLSPVVFSAGFIAGVMWWSSLHRCKPIHVIGVGDLDDAHCRGVEDERARRDAEIRRLEKAMAR
jgi:hypothetical protein